MRSRRMMLTGAVAAIIGLALIASLTPTLIFAQSSSVEGSAQSQISYKTAYSKASADSSNSVIVQTEHHLYKPGDTVKVTGSVSSEMREQTKSDTVNIKLMDTYGAQVTNQQAKVNSNGDYSASLTLPANAGNGSYSTDSKIEVEASILGLLNAQITAKLESSTTFVVASSSSHNVKASSGESFTVDIASNSTVGNAQLNENQKMVGFSVEGQSGTKGVTQVKIPKAMLSGEMTVSIDGKTVASDSNDVIVTSNTSTETTFEINYSHSKHDVFITGTNVVPEFPLALVMMAAGLGSVVAIMTIAKKRSSQR